MSEIAGDMTPGEYQGFVKGRIYNPDKPGWETDFATYVKDELVEVMDEHNRGAAGLLITDESGSAEPVTEPVAVAMLDELMDMSWFGVAIAELSGLDAGELSIASLERHTGQSFRHATTLRALQRAVMQNAVSIEIARGEPDSVNLQLDPIGALKRATRQLSDSLVSHGERAPDRKEAVGDFANTIFYIVGTKLGWDIEEAVQYNVYKLRERDMWGKGKDEDEVECTYGNKKD